MFGQFYGVPSSTAWARADALIEVVALEEQAHQRINRLSTGQRQRMNFARGFMSDPEVLFLDEPTLGMDVTAARKLREYVAAWVRERAGRTVLLTTHYMAEAEQLCDRVAIIDRGRVLARPHALRQASIAGRAARRARVVSATAWRWPRGPGAVQRVGSAPSRRAADAQVRLRPPHAAPVLIPRGPVLDIQAVRPARPRSRTCSCQARPGPSMTAIPSG